MQCLFVYQMSDEDGDQHENATTRHPYIQTSDVVSHLPSPPAGPTVHRSARERLLRAEGHRAAIDGRKTEGKCRAQPLPQYTDIGVMDLNDCRQ